MPITVANSGGLLKRKYVATKGGNPGADLPDDPGKDAWISTILNQNKNKDFVKRIQDPDNSPMVQNSNGTHSSHIMASSNNDDGPVAYPIMVRLKGQKRLIKLQGKMAERYAHLTGEQIKFNSDDQAEEFANNGYKRGWGVKGP